MNKKGIAGIVIIGIIMVFALSGLFIGYQGQKYHDSQREAQHEVK